MRWEDELFDRYYKGKKEGIEQERVNTIREMERADAAEERADAAEAEVLKLQAELAALKNGK